MKERLLYLLQRFSPPISIERLSRWTNQQLIFPFYHTIQGDRLLPHIKHLYPLRSIQQFTADLDFFLNHFQVIGLSDLIAHLEKGQALPENAFLLSFDDGLREVYDIAVPILKQKGVPATIFLNSAFVDNRGLFFRYKASLLIEHFNTTTISKVVIRKVNDCLHKKQIDYKTGLKNTLLNISYAQKEVLDEIARLVSFDFTTFLSNYQPYLTHSQINSMIADSFTFGAHSVDHPKYAALSLEAQIDQTKTSVDWVQNQFNLDYKSFAFPFTDDGVKKTFFETVKKQNIAMPTFGCAGLKKQTMPTHFQRIPVEMYATTAQQQLQGEYWYYLLKSMIGKNQVLR